MTGWHASDPPHAMPTTPPLAADGDRLVPVCPPGSSAAQPWPLHDTAGSRALEQAGQSALPAHTLMRRAGQAVGRLGRALVPHGRRAVIFAGPGNNGGDALEAAVHLLASGWSVCVHQLGCRPGRPLPSDAAHALMCAREAGVPIVEGLPEPVRLATADLVIDGLLGLGVTRAPDGEVAAAIGLINGARGEGALPVLAIDVPSGLNPDTGCVPGVGLQACVRASHTLSLLTLKPGLFTAQGRDHAGSVWFDDLGVERAPATAAAWLSAPLAAPGRLHAQHKGSFGSAAVLAGAPGMTGAAWLAAQAALRAGAGRVHVQLLAQAAASSPAPAELMVREAIDWATAAREGWVVIAGCGGADAVAAHLPALLAEQPRLVLDADGLNALARCGALQEALAERSDRRWQTVLTPHPLEAARLLGCGVSQVQADRLSAAQRLARKLRCIVALKGSGTIIASADGPTWVNPTGNARLGTAGTGDVLAGWVGGLWAAQAANGWDASLAVRQAVYAHGRLADTWPPHRALTAGALADAVMPDAAADLR